MTRTLPTSFFSTDPATTEIYTLSLHDALPIWLDGRSGQAPASARARLRRVAVRSQHRRGPPGRRSRGRRVPSRSEEHTSELQSHVNLVCRLLLEKKNRRIF